MNSDVLSSVSESTDYVVVGFWAGDEAGSKLEKAVNLKVRIVEEKQFLRSQAS